MHIVTLPITPKEERPFTTFMTPFAADVLHRYFGIPLTIMLNTTGERFKRSNASSKELYEWYYRQLVRLGIVCHQDVQVLHDGETPYEYHVRNTLPEIEKRVKSAHERILTCPCGAVEIPQYVYNDLERKKRAHSLIVKDAAGIRCAICHEFLISSQQWLLALNLPRPALDWVWPEIYAKEVERVLERVCSHPLYITRHQRSSSYRYELLGEQWTLDTDFRWMMYIPYAVRSASHVIVVSALTTLNQAIRTMSLSKLLWPSVHFSLFIHPLMYIIDQRTSLRDATIEAYNDLCGHMRIRRIFLSLGFQWRHQTSEVSSKELYLTRLTAPFWPSVASEQGSLDTQNVLRAMEKIHRMSILRLMKKLRARQKLSQDELRICAILT
jgi:hypothetical protein